LAHGAGAEREPGVREQLGEALWAAPLDPVELGEPHGKLIDRGVDAGVPGNDTGERAVREGQVQHRGRRGTR
jgi:hypothetical protein